jgi:hypothetical protein
MQAPHTHTRSACEWHQGRPAVTQQFRDLCLPALLTAGLRSAAALYPLVQQAERNTLYTVCGIHAGIELGRKIYCKDQYVQAPIANANFKLFNPICFYESSPLPLVFSLIGRVMHKLCMQII